MVDERESDRETSHEQNRRRKRHESKSHSRWRRGQRRCHGCARRSRRRELADVVIVDIADTKAAGVALDIYQSCPIEGSASRVVGVGTKDFAESANSDVVVITSGVPRKPGHEPRRPAVGQLQDHAGRDGRDRQALAQLHHRAGRQPARRDVAGGLSPEQVPARARHRHGRRARLGAHAHVHRRWS